MNHHRQHTHQYRSALDDYLERGVETPALRAAFPDEESLVRALHQRWVSIVDGCLETELETGSGTLAESLRAAYRTALTHAPALKAELDRHADNPVLRALTERHDVALARATGFLRPGHSVHEGLFDMRSALASVVLVPRQRDGRRDRRRRSREVRRLVTASIRGY
jgi:hypothetical protein